MDDPARPYPPNPLAREAWFPSDAAVWLRLGDASIVGLCSMIIWDILHSFREEVLLIRRSRLSLPTITYVVARIMPLFFMLSIASPVFPGPHNCNIVAALVLASYIATYLSYSLLFLFRVLAIYTDHRGVRWFMTTMWIISVGPTIGFAFTTEYVRLQPTDYCVGLISDELLLATIIVQAAYEVTVCIAITYKLNSDESRLGRASWRTMGYRVTNLGERFLKDSQIYFISTIVFKLVELILILVMGGTSSSFLGVIDTGVISIIATRIFRQLKIGNPGLLDEINVAAQGANWTSVLAHQDFQLRPITNPRTHQDHAS